MLIEKIAEAPDAAIIHMERYVNKGSPSGFTFNNTTSAQTSPFQDQGTFKLPCVEVPRIECETRGGATSIPNILCSNNMDTVIYPVHPDILDEVLSAVDCDIAVIKEIDVYPTANGRTVMHIGDDDIFFVKLHYPKLIGRFNRALPYRKWVSSFENNDELVEAIEKGEAPKCFALLKENAGHILMYNGDENSGMGMIFREYQAYPYHSDRKMIPFFSLFSKDTMFPNDPLLIDQLMGREDFAGDKVIDVIVKPILLCFKFQAIDLGLLPEYNAQNVLMEWFLPDGSTRLIHRDMTGTFKDISRRRSLGLHTNFNPYHSIDFERDKEEVFMRRSFAYDFKIGEYIFREVELWLSERRIMKADDFRQKVRTFFREIIPEDTESYFKYKNKWIGYKKALPHGKRPYVEYTNPRYR